MKSLNIFKEDIKSCSRCGLCMAVCPVYQITKNDCTSPRGKLILLYEILKKNIKPSKKMKNYMNMCINCEKCTQYCPGKIDITKISKAFNNDCPFFSFNIASIPILIRYFLNSVLIRKKNLPKGGKIIYLTLYQNKNIPSLIKNSSCKFINECGIPMKFALLYPKLYKEMSKITAKNVLSANPDIIFTDSSLCKTELETGLALLGIKNQKIFIFRIK